MKSIISLMTVFSLSLVAFAAQDEDFEISADIAPPEVATSDQIDAADAIRVSLSEDGVLTGLVFKQVDDRQQPVTAKVTISKLNGETISSELTEKDGSFAFESIEPGYYTIVGVGQGYYGDQTIDVTSYGEAYTAQVPVEVAPGGFDAGVVYSGYQDAPLNTFSSAPVYSSGGGCGVGSCGSCGGGCGSAGGRRGLRALLPLVGLVGLVGLADDDDTSPVE